MTFDSGFLEAGVTSSLAAVFPTPSPNTKPLGTTKCQPKVMGTEELPIPTTCKQDTVNHKTTSDTPGCFRQSVGPTSCVHKHYKQHSLMNSRPARAQHNLLKNAQPARSTKMSETHSYITAKALEMTRSKTVPVSFVKTINSRTRFVFEM